MNKLNNILGRIQARFSGFNVERIVKNLQRDISALSRAEEAQRAVAVRENRLSDLHDMRACRALLDAARAARIRNKLGDLLT